jgi:hypothetical protein
MIRVGLSQVKGLISKGHWETDTRSHPRMISGFTSTFSLGEKMSGGPEWWRAGTVCFSLEQGGHSTPTTLPRQPGHIRQRQRQTVFRASQMTSSSEVTSTDDHELSLKNKTDDTGAKSNSHRNSSSSPGTFALQFATDFPSQYFHTWNSASQRLLR